MLNINFDPFPVLTTDRLVLRELNLNDASAMLAMRSHPAVMDHLHLPKLKYIEDAEAFIQKLIDGTENNEWVNWAICKKEDPHLMGTYVIWHISAQNRRGEIGYMLHPDFQRKGYAQEATEAVLRYAFEDLGLHSLEAWTSPENESSLNLLKRNGFEKEAHLKENVCHNNQYYDTVIYSLISPGDKKPVSGNPSLQNVIDCYDKTAEAYAGEFLDELAKKHLDRILLKAFAKKVQSPVADFGCGPGQTTRFLKDCGVEDIIGVDLSTGMVEVAAKQHIDIPFINGNMLELDFEDRIFKGAIAFYAIVHFTPDQLKKALGEIYRVLAVGGEFLFSFHIGTGTVHHDEFLGKKVNVDFYFFETGEVVELAKQTGFKVVDIVERQPYEGAEYPSQRAYIWLSKL